MINNEILSFIKDQVAQGTTKAQVKDMLVTQGGWDEKDVEEAFETINFSGASYPAILKNAEVETFLSSKADESTKTLKTSFAPALELMNASADRPKAFAPGISHIEQPKRMEPTIQNSSALPNVTPALRAVFEPQKNISEPPAIASGGANTLGSLRERIASGISSTSLPQPISIFPQPPVSAQSAAKPVSVEFPESPISKTPVLAPAFSAPNSILPKQAYPAVSGQSEFSPLPSLNKVSPTQVTSVPAPAAAQSPQQPISLFQKAALGSLGGPRVSPTPAQLATLQTQRSGGNRFLSGLLLFLIGIAIGGLAMNAYMNDYLHTPAVNGLIEKGMNMIGLGSVSPTSETLTPETFTPVDPASQTP